MLLGGCSSSHRPLPLHFDSRSFHVPSGCRKLHPAGLVKIHLLNQAQVAEGQLYVLCHTNVLAHSVTVCGDAPTPRYALRKQIATTPTASDKPPQKGGHCDFPARVQASNHLPEDRYPIKLPLPILIRYSSA